MLQEKILDEIKQISDKKLVEIYDCGALLSVRFVAGVPIKWRLIGLAKGLVEIPASFLSLCPGLTI